jgi:hypothetical protein
MADYPPDELLEIYDDIKKRVHERFERRSHFVGNLAGFAGTVFVVYVLGQMNVLPNWITSILPWVMGAWLIGLSVETAKWLMYELRERAVRREIERAGLGLVQHRLISKRKRIVDEPPERLVRLSDDGEIIDLYHDDYADEDYERHHSG